MLLLRGNLTSLYLNLVDLLQITVINDVKFILVIKCSSGLKYYLQFILWEVTIFNSMYVCVSFHHTNTYVYMHSSIKRQNCQLIY